MFADLHLHTNFSDGTYTPEQLAAHGRANGLAVLALTDHDTVEGCPRMGAACKDAGVEFIPGTELTAEVNGHEAHLLGYFLDIEDPAFLAEIVKFQAARENRIHEMVARLNRLNVPLKAEAVFALANCRSPGRPHVARALVQAGLCKNLDEAFERFLKIDRPAWVPKTKISAVNAIELIHNAGGLASLAHPALNKTDKMIAELVEAGLDGIECFHSKHTPALSERYLQIAAQYNLLITGGSDCHGTNKGKPLIGTVKLPFEHVQKMKDRLRPHPGRPQKS
jgi:predicted metal-dependent phosphoesterase TrpH